jgi:hypothetical protein
MMTDRKAVRVFTYDALEEIKTALIKSESVNDFLSAVDEIIEEDTKTLSWPVDLGVLEGLVIGDEYSNAKEVFEYIGLIDRANAADSRLWTYMAFKTFRPYMEKRWPLEGEKWKERVRRRWLLPFTVSRGQLIRHGIARLWWVAELTVDEKFSYPLSKNNGNAYAYTSEVFKKEDRLLAIYDREIGSSPRLVRAVLEHVVSDGRYESEKHFRKLLKELTLVHGYRDTIIMSDDQIAEVVQNAASWGSTPFPRTVLKRR